LCVDLTDGARGRGRAVDATRCVHALLRVGARFPFLIGEGGIGDLRLTVLVTHDHTEAVALGDWIVVMEGGEVLQSGAVADVFSRPADARVARIVGTESILPGRVVAVEEGLATVDVAGVHLTAVAPPGIAKMVHVCLRAAEVMLLPDLDTAISARNRFAATVRFVVPEGALVRVGLDAGFDLTALITRAAAAELAIEPGTRVIAAVKAPAIHLLPRGG
jgi:molybdate transport system ATP-binding protein